MHPKTSKFFIIIFIFLGILIIPLFTKAVEPEYSHPFTEQKTFNLDLETKNFTYEQRELNESGPEYSYTYEYNEESNNTFLVQIPKKSKIISSSIDLTGLIIVNKTNIGIELDDVDIGDVTSDSGNEISFVFQLSSNNIRLYDNKKNFLWQNVSGDNALDVEIGNITIDSENEVIAGTYNGIVVLNKEGNKLYEKSTVGIVSSVCVKNLTSDNGNEIIAGGANLYLLNSSLDLLQNDSTITNGDINSVFVEDVTSSSQGNEIVMGTGGSENKIYLLNYTNNNFTEIWSYNVGGDVKGVYVENISQDSGKEIIAVTSGGDNKVYALNSTGQLLWSYGLEDYGLSVHSNEFSDISPGKEIAVGAGWDTKNKIYVLTSNGSSLLNYTTDDRVRGITMGNVTADSGNNINEILGVTRNGSVYELNYDNFPENVSVRVNGSLVWSMEGKFRYLQNLNFTNITNSIQNFLDSCQERVCEVPFKLYSAHKGRIKVSNINISYIYNASSDIYNETLYPSWSRTQNIHVNESIVSEAINISYTEPALNISIHEIKINNGATSCGFKNEVYFVSNISSDDYCNVTSKGIKIVPGKIYTYHLLWDNQMQKDIPIYMNESGWNKTHGIDNNLWVKNITIWNSATGESFTTIIANTTVNDSLVKGESFLNVTWGGTNYNITPNTQCPSMSSLGNGFTGCWNDTNTDGIIDFFNWTQPNASAGSSVNYKVGGTRNLAPNITSSSVNPSSGFWGEYFNFTANVHDEENDNISVTLWVYTNFTQTWEEKGSQNISGSGLISFNISSDKSWVGKNKYKFEYYDYNSSGNQMHYSRNTEEISEPLGELHNVILNHVKGNNTNVSREYGETSTELMVYYNDTSGYENWNNEYCNFTFDLYENLTDWGHMESINESGYCSHYFNPNGSYPVGLHSWYTSINESFYNVTNMENYLTRVMGHINISIDIPVPYQRVIRNETLMIQGKIIDEYGNAINSSLNHSDYDCNFYFNRTFIGQSQINSSGYCDYEWIPNCTYQILGPYIVNLTLVGEDSVNYTILDNESRNFVELKDYSYIDITSPPEGTKFYKGVNVTLNATVNDTCKTCDINQYKTRWYINFRDYSNLYLEETSGIVRYREPIEIYGSDLENSGANLTKWKTNDTKVKCSGKEMPIQITGSGKYINSTSKITFLVNLTELENKLCYIFNNETNSLQNQTLSYIKNSGFESGTLNNWNYVVKTYPGDPQSRYVCSIKNESETGNYSAYIYAYDDTVHLNQSINNTLNSDYIKIKYKAWGTYSDNSYVKILGDNASCLLNLSHISYSSESSATWNDSVCYNESFFNSSNISIVVYDQTNDGYGTSASHIYIDYLCTADPYGNCILLDSGAEGITKRFNSKENISSYIQNNTEGKWPIPLNYPVGGYTIFSNISGDYYISSQNVTYIDIFGFANVSHFNFTPLVDGECQGNLCFAGSDISLVCGIFDKNTSQGVHNFTVNFYNETTHIASAQTNESGFAVYNWINSTQSTGTKNIKCNISDSPSIYYDANEENSMNFTINFASDTTNGTMNITSQKYQILENITKEKGDSGVFNITVNNTGEGSMFGINVLVYNQTGITGCSNICNYLENGTSCSGNVTLSASRLAELGNNSIEIGLRWSNPFNSTWFENKTIKINVTNTTFVNFVEDYVNYTIPYGSSGESFAILEDFGNTGLKNATFSIYGGNSNLLKNWIKINGTLINQTNLSVQRLSNSSLNISITVPNNSTHMNKNYWAYITARENKNCIGIYDSCNDSLMVNVSVTEHDWSVMPDPSQTERKLVGRNVNNAGSFQLINITNRENFNITLNVTLYSNGFNFFNYTLENNNIKQSLPVSNFTLLPYSSSSINLTYWNITNESVPGIYYINISIERLEPFSATPDWINMSRILEISDFEIEILKPNKTSVISDVENGTSIEIRANATKSNDVHILENITWKAWIGGQFCNITKNESNLTGANFDWNITCVAPSIPGNPINNSIILSANYSRNENQSVVFNYTKENVIIYRDIKSPSFSIVEVEHVNKLRNIQSVIFEVNITDNKELDSFWSQIDSKGNTWNLGTDNYTETLLSSSQGFDSRKITFNFSNPNTVGDYDITVYANDTAGNPTNSTIGWFDVYEPIQILGNMTDLDNDKINASFTFYRNSKNLDEFYKMNETSTEDNESYNWTLHKRKYDIKSELFGQEIIFYNASLNITDNTEPIRFDYFETYDEVANKANIEISNEFHSPIMGIVIDTNVTQDARIIINSTNAFDDAISSVGWDLKAANLRVLKCSNWDYENRNCNTTLGESHVVSDSPQNKVFNFTSDQGFSAFFISDINVEAGDGDDDNNGPGGTTGGTTGGTDASTEETEIDPFDIDTNLGNLILYQGESGNYWISIKNNMESQISPKIYLSGKIAEFISLSKTEFDLEGKNVEIIDVLVSVPKNKEAGTYTGNLEVEAYGEKEIVPLTLKVVSEGEGILSLEVDIIKKKILIEEYLKFQIKMRNMGIEKELKPTLTYLIKDGKNDKIVKELKENVTIEKMLSFTKRLELNDTGLDEGEHILEVWAETEGKAVNDMESFEIIKPFFATKLGTSLLWIALVLSILVASIFLRKYYSEWKKGKESKKRYLFPVNMKKVPQKTDRSFWIGTIAGSKIKSWINPDDLTTHMLVAGATGSGKSVGASVIVEEALEQKIPVIVFDPTSQWTGFVRSCRDQNLLRYYPSFGMDTKNVKPYKGMIFEMNNPNQKIDFKELMNPGEITVFTLNNLKPEEFDESVRNIISSMFRINWEESTTLKMIVVFDEVHRLLEKYGGKGGYIALEKACREFRKWGIGIIMCSQVLADFKEAVSGNVLTDVQLNTKSLEDIKKARDKYGEKYAKRITRQGLGVGMIHNPKYNNGKPYFVQFRPTYHNPHKITNEELEQYKEFAKDLKSIKNVIKKMEEEGKDVFDLKLELRLAEDKLKLGNFRMAKIYITSLKEHLDRGV